MNFPLAFERNDSDPFDFAVRVERFYAALMQTASAGSVTDAEPGLGGKLLYVADLCPRGRALVVAANIAGAASLIASADLPAQKQAVRDGVVDFLVTSLDEAVRILKNEIRKRETVAVCVAAAPEAVECEMLERGVLPDLLSPAASRGSNDDAFLKQGGRRVETGAMNENRVFVAWQVDAAPARWLPQIDAIALDGLDANDLFSRRWMRLAPRFLGHLAQGIHLLAADRESAERLVDAIHNEVGCGNIPVPVEILVRGPGAQPEHRLRLEKPLEPPIQSTS